MLKKGLQEETADVASKAQKRERNGFFRPAH